MWDRQPTIGPYPIGGGRPVIVRDIPQSPLGIRIWAGKDNKAARDLNIYRDRIAYNRSLPNRWLRSKHI
ncbi:hypothetical protein CEXT_629081 [Caerostris extrusa]|uniref:Uncharacterized protein n=1 Tax=Caerostris extrusa TaxID=172846 RepID=A0AAV4W242_CAEEX|nr:hypothetical protein CEXT_629081 [Caerostris extrusa]